MGVQLELPLDHAPAPVRQHGLRAAHPRPLVSMGKRPGKPFTSFRTSPKKAWSFPEVEYANAGSSVAALVLDCDDPAAMARGLADLPDPNWIVRRVANGHAHPAWTLAAPVHRYPKAKPEPLIYLSRVADYYATTTGADGSYSGVLAHNPAPRYRETAYRTTWGREAPYSLDDLASVIPFGWKPPGERQTGIGRNCDLFAGLMAWAGRKENAGISVLAAAVVRNQHFDHPLPDSEVAATARSVERYRERWAARGWHCPRWIARQAARGRKGGRPRLYEPGREPWTLAGISRRTWYRRRRGTKANTDKRA